MPKTPERISVIRERSSAGRFLAAMCRLSGTVEVEVRGSNPPHFPPISG